MASISVLLPVYNAEKYLNESIESILNQTFTDFELLIIDDGSTDKSWQIIQSFDDRRIQVIRNDKNLGLIKTLNKGINLAKGKYIARMDADDIASQQRLEKQFNFLEQNPQYALIGSQAKFIFENKSSNIIFEIPTNDDEIPIFSLFNCPFIHPSIMIRTEVLKEFYYNEDFATAEDYELWTRILKKYKGSNIKEVLLSYRIHGNNISTIENHKQVESVRKIYQQNLSHIGISYTSEDLDIFLKTSASYHQNVTFNDLKSIKLWLIKIQSFLQKEGIYKKESIQEVIKTIWFNTCSKSRYNGIKVFFLYLFQWQIKKHSPFQIFKLLVQCLSSYSVFEKIREKIIRFYRYY